MKVRNLIRHLIGGIMAMNFLVSLIVAICIPDILTFFVCYVSFSPTLLHLKLINSGWLFIMTEGKAYPHFRAMFLWPITLYESMKHGRAVKRMAVLARELEKMGDDEIVDSEELKELQALHFSLKTFSDKAFKMYQSSQSKN